MAEAIVTLPDGRRARITGATREAIMQTAREMSADTARPEPGSPEALGQLMRAGERGELPRPAQSSGFDVVKEFAQGRRLPNNALVLGTIGSIAFPPLRAGMARSSAGGLTGLLSRAGQRVAPPVAATSGIGGTVAGIEESQRPGATPASIAREGLGTGARLGAAELAGLGLTTGAAKLVAPRLGFLDPLKGARRQLGEFVKTVPERARNAARRVTEMLPEGGAQNAAQAVGDAAVKASRVVRELAEQNALGKAASGAAKTVGQRQKTAAAVAKALGDRTARRFGYNEREGSQRFLFQVWQSGNEQVLKTIRKRLGKQSFEDFQAQTLSTLITRASRRGRDGELRLDGDRLRELWDELPEASRAIYSPGARRAIESLATFGSATARLARFAATPTGSELAEAIVAPLMFAAGGPALGFPFMVAKQLLFPGPLTRFLTRDKLPNEVIQMIGGQTIKTPLRAGALEETK